MTESAPESLASLQHRLQLVVNATTATHRGARHGEAMEALQRALVAADLPDQPAPWMRSSASEICAGRLVVLNNYEIPDELEQVEPDPEQHAAG
ncbi:hypothetical protein [uncultured Pseudokineococcus sp.]|uniref:hypothetical protein n=1 Tax=uncultured Pseudokineococcus sp. TaxID=1642928 RepID=UPI002613F6D4|nr:hypothetical protein [uncultured Pseudokineococcus sp.]